MVSRKEACKDASLLSLPKWCFKPCSQWKERGSRSGFVFVNIYGLLPNKALLFWYMIIWGAFGPGKASKVENLSSRGVSYLHHRNAPLCFISSQHPRLCALCSYSWCAAISASATTHLWLAATPLSLPRAGTVYDTLNLLCYTLIWLCKDHTRYRVY